MYNYYFIEPVKTNCGGGLMTTAYDVFLDDQGDKIKVATFDSEDGPYGAESYVQWMNRRFSYYVAGCRSDPRERIILDCKDYESAEIVFDRLNPLCSDLAIYQSWEEGGITWNTKLGSELRLST